MSLNMRTILPLLIIVFIAFSCGKQKNETKVGSEIPDWIEYKFMNYENYYVDWHAQPHEKRSSNYQVDFHPTGCTIWYSAKISRHYDYQNLNKEYFNIIWSKKGTPNYPIPLIDSSH